MNVRVSTKSTQTEKSVRDYTTGSLWHHFLVLACPLILGNILQQLYNTIDAAVISRYASQAEFAAVGVSSTIMNLALFAIVGICTGVSVLLAQSYGSGDLSKFRRYHFLVLVMGLLFSLLISLPGILFIPRLLRVTSTPQELLQPSAMYLRIVLAGMCISFLYNVYAAILRSVGKAGIALGALALAVGLNLLLDLLFVAGWHKGIAGAAAATVMAQSVSALFCMFYLYVSRPDLCFHADDCHPEGRDIRQILSVCSVTCIHQVSLYIGKLFVQSSVNAAGTQTIAAYTAGTRIEGFANSFGDSGSAATSVLAAQNFGTGKEERVSRVFRISLTAMLVLGTVSSLLLYASAPTVLRFLLAGAGTSSLQEAVSYLRTIALFYIFCFTGNTFAGYFEGTGRPAVTFIGALSHMTLRILLCFRFVPVYGLQAVAAACGIGWICVNLFWTCMKRRLAARGSSPAPGQVPAPVRSGSGAA